MISELRVRVPPPQLGKTQGGTEMIKDYPLKRYKFFVTGRKSTIAETKFMGRKVRAKALLAEGDEYDEHAGKVLAAARCNEKVAEIRMKKAEKRLAEAADAAKRAQAELAEATMYAGEAEIGLLSARKRTKNVLADLKN